SIFIDVSLERENIDDLKAMALAHRVVIKIMGRCDLDYPGAKFGVHIVIGNNGYFTSHQGQHHCLPDELAIALILRVYHNGHVTKHGLGPGSSNVYMTALWCTV